MPPNSTPSQEELQRRRIVGVNLETVTHVTSTDFPGHYPGEDHAWSIQKFKNSFDIEFHANEPLRAEFSLIGVDASIANAFRRIMIAEIPSVAIEYVFINNNTSIIQDEVLAQRLGLIPFTGSREGFQFMKWYRRPTEENPEPDPNGSTDFNTIKLSLKINCARNPGAPRGSTDPMIAYKNAHVYAKDIVYEPIGQQHKYFGFDPRTTFRPTNPDILIAKLRPGQCLDMEMHAIKGIGSDHSKFSPVATASYRLLPTIDIVKPILGADAKKFAQCFNRGVIDISQRVTAEEASREGSGYEGHEGQMKAVVKNAFYDTVSRECLRHAEFEGKVKLGRVRDHFIFEVESVGQWDSDLLFLESVAILRKKCVQMKKAMTMMIDV